MGGGGLLPRTPLPTGLSPRQCPQTRPGPGGRAPGGVPLQRGRAGPGLREAPSRAPSPKPKPPAPLGRAASLPAPSRLSLRRGPRRPLFSPHPPAPQRLPGPAAGGRRGETLRSPQPAAAPRRRRQGGEGSANRGSAERGSPPPGAEGVAGLRPLPPPARAVTGSCR